MMRLIFATNNQHKVNEIRNALSGSYNIISLKEAGIDKDIPEPHDTLAANATEKSTVIFEMTGENCFSEDTGLEVDAINGAPGVYSARYAGENASFSDNVEKLLKEMEGKSIRDAKFKTVISLIIDGKETQFIGECAGKITEKVMGNNGFGYDPVFIPDGADNTFAEMTMEEKKVFSHRAKAVEKLVLFLKGVRLS
ncbi:MAG: RdgB/HAM1 family non-canonical purine NTP pyrophosphatase [Niabella sp.]